MCQQGKIYFYGNRPDVVEHHRNHEEEPCTGSNDKDQRAYDLGACYQSHQRHAYQGEGGRYLGNVVVQGYDVYAVSVIEQ